MKRVLMIASAVSVACALQWGWPRPAAAGNGKHYKEHRLNVLNERLKLDDTQKKAIEAAFHEREGKMKALHEEFSAKRKAIDDQTDQKVLGALNEQQKTKYAEMKAERAKRREEMKEHREDHDDKPNDK